MRDLRLSEDLKRCVAFHGHLCPGVVIGYCAAQLGMRTLDARRADDEELLAVVENDTCAVDAIQVVTGCTFGKGNLFFRDHGKMVFTFATRADGRFVRLGLLPINPPGIGVIAEDRRRRHQVEFMLAHDPSEFFVALEGTMACLPPPARIHESVPCDLCGEMVMSTRLRRHRNLMVCIPCYERAPKDVNHTKQSDALNPMHRCKETKNMKIAIPVADGRLCMHFGHCEQFAMVDVDDASKTITATCFLTPPPHEPDVLPRWLHERGANVILAGGMGQRAQSLFAQNGIQVVVGAPADKLDNVVSAYLSGTLKVGQNVCDH